VRRSSEAWQGDDRRCDRHRVAIVADAAFNIVYQRLGLSDEHSGAAYRGPRLTMSYGSRLIRRTSTHGEPRRHLRDHGGSGCGKSTLLKHMIACTSPPRNPLRRRELPARGDEERDRMRRRWGITYQGGACSAR